LHHTTVKIVISSTTVGDRGKRRAARGWMSASQQQTLSGRAARVYTCTWVHDNMPCRRLPRWADNGPSLLCLGGHGLHCSGTYSRLHATCAAALQACVFLSMQSGFSPLHIAAHYGNVSVARLLIQHGADVNRISDKVSHAPSTAILRMI